MYTRNDLWIESCSTSLYFYQKKRTLHKILTQLKTTCTQRQNHQNLTTFFIDYETAVSNSTRPSFPGITFRGCLFRYTQCTCIFGVNSSQQDWTPTTTENLTFTNFHAGQKFFILYLIQKKKTSGFKHL